MTLEIIGLISLLLLSGFFSSSELAFIIANKIKIEIRARKKNLAAENAMYFINSPQTFFSTLLISNNIVNIAFASLLTIFLNSVYDFSEIQILIISTLLLLFFGELIPKYFAREFADSLILIIAVPVRVISFLIHPFVKVTSGIAAILTRTAGQKEVSLSDNLDKEDMHSLLTESSGVGHVEEDETDVINKVLELGEQKIYEAMTPRTDIIGVEINSDIESMLKTFIDSGYSKLPVYEENLDNIKGMVIAYDMFKMPDNLNNVLREILFVPETKKTLEALNEFLDKQVSIAIVVDEFGGTAGIVTVEDILEEILGEIRDEYDVEEDICKKVDEKTFIISGKVEIDYINEEYDLKIPEGDYETLAGYIINNTGKIPIKGETFTIDHFKVLILRSFKTKIDLVKIVVDANALNEMRNT